ncbi:MAG: DUF3179 domain-containing protein [Gammaproteobacteria bacterium]|nr:DUF3179 domain-containing protein [Gammaproteobacteria bacterium]
MQLEWLKKNRILVLLSLLLGAVTIQYSANAISKNGFDISNAVIPQGQILPGGPPKDGIPAISDPKLILASQVDYLADKDRIVGIEIDGIAKAYPISILNWHEIVNDKINGQSYAITYCPLCGTAVAFDANIEGSVTEFGVSGLLYNSDVLLYDRNTESLWSQISSSSISGEMVGKKLKRIPISHTTWQAWQQKHPDTLVLSDETGFSRDYARDPYAGYEQSSTLYFQVNNRAPSSYHPKELVVGVEFGGVYKAYPFVELEKNSRASFADSVNGTNITIHWDEQNRAVTITDESNKEIAGIQGFWFAWFAFHPDTEVFRAGQI